MSRQRPIPSWQQPEAARDGFASRDASACCAPGPACALCAADDQARIISYWPFPGGVEALRDVSLDLGAGAFVALLGPSGCGKSTLLRLIAGLDQPDSGALRWQQGHAPGVGEIGFVFQDATLLPWASTADNVYLPLRLRGIPRARAAADIAAVARPRRPEGFERAAPAPSFPAACACASRSPARW